MIGPRVGPRAGQRVGIAFGVGADPIAPGNRVAGVSYDATSGKACPANATEWTALLAAAGISSGNPANLWLCQDLILNLADAIGATTLTASGSGTLGNAVTGWARTSVDQADGTVGSGWSSSATVNLATTSALMLAYLQLTATPAAEREIVGLGSGTDHRYVAVTAGGKYKATGLAGASATGTATPGTVVRPVIIKVDRGHSAFKVYTNQETLAPAWTAPSGGGALLEVGDAVGGGSAPVKYLYLALFTGASAELSDVQVATLLTTLGW